MIIMESVVKSVGVLLFLFAGFSSFAVSDENENCPIEHMECNVTKKCVPFTWRCDNAYDCGQDDMSDEENCPNKTCTELEFPCGVSGVCISQRWICDGESDCDNGADEDSKLCSKQEGCKPDEFVCGDGNCITKYWVCDGVEDCNSGNDERNCTKTCEGDMFTCGNGDCISMIWKCDGDYDCIDKSDEKSCSEKVCPKDEFKCNDSTRCIDKKWTCDGDFDCADRSDESHICSNSSHHPDRCVSEKEFKCKTSGECIHNSWKCDGDPDCADGSDEGPLCNYVCRKDQFKCKNNICIAKILHCDHNLDCLDGSDESNCSVIASCAERGEFDCYGDGSFCIVRDKVCDGHNDCQHREDEDSILCKHKNPCASKSPCGDHAHCENIAVTVGQPVQAVCVCDSGFLWNNDTKLCKDIDECEQQDSCSQICTNTRGGYKCDCLPGYQLERNVFCRADGEHAWLYYSSKRDIRRISPDSRYMEIVVQHTSNSIALDIDVARGIMFWTDGQDETIYRINISTKENHMSSTDEHQVIFSNDATETFSPDGIALDWLYLNIYWTDTGSDKIRVADYNGQKTKTLISSGLHEPRAIVVDPENGYMYWTDWGREPKIERCGMDGNKRTVIVSKTDDLLWPNGLAIDYISQRIYWIDAKLHKIGSANLDGSDPVHILVDAREIVLPFSIAVFEDSLYWSDWHANSIHTAHKVTGRNPRRLSMDSHSVMDIKVIHALKQSKDFQVNATALCRNANCEYLCLPTAHIDSKLPKAVTCACADGSQLKSDGRTCELASTSGDSTATPNTSSPPSYTTDAPTRKATSSNMTEATTLTIGALGQSQTATDTHGRYVIIGTIVAFVIVATIIVVFILFKRSRSRAKKSMNFDNPVYRKTTTILSDDEPQREPLTSHLDV